MADKNTSPLAYVVTAYRYGMRDAHSYVVAVCDDLQQAKDAADSEVDWRGGKYGCEVVSCHRTAWGKDRESPQIYYKPSPYKGIVGEGYEQADTTTDGWQERMIANIRARKG